jgi:hypothetical protein
MVLRVECSKLLPGQAGNYVLEGERESLPSSTRNLLIS